MAGPAFKNGLPVFSPGGKPSFACGGETFDCACFSMPGTLTVSWTAEITHPANVGNRPAGAANIAGVDLSSGNVDVFHESGCRWSYEMPVTLIADMVWIEDTCVPGTVGAYPGTPGRLRFEVNISSPGSNSFSIRYISDLDYSTIPIGQCVFEGLQLAYADLLGVSPGDNPSSGRFNTAVSGGVVDCSSNTVTYSTPGSTGTIYARTETPGGLLSSGTFNCCVTAISAYRIKLLTASVSW